MSRKALRPSNSPDNGLTPVTGSSGGPDAGFVGPDAGADAGTPPAGAVAPVVGGAVEVVAQPGVVKVLLSRET